MEEKLALTVGASIEIAKLCKDEDFGNVGLLLTGEGKSYEEQTRTWAQIISILSKAADGEHYLTVEDVLGLEMPDYILLREKVFKCFDVDTAVTVKLESQKKRQDGD